MPEINLHNSQLSEVTAVIRATLLAREGDLAGAGALLLPLLNTPNIRTDVLDLTAKVFAQQGKMEQAQAMWGQALQHEPNNPHFQRAYQLCAPKEKTVKSQHLSFHFREIHIVLALVIVSMVLLAIDIIA